MPRKSTTGNVYDADMSRIFLSVKSRKGVRGLRVLVICNYPGERCSTRRRLAAEGYALGQGLYVA